MIKKIAQRFSKSARAKRAKMFRDLLYPTEEDKILDLGGSDGSHFASISSLYKNVYIADIDEEKLNQGVEKYGYHKVKLEETDRLPFPDQFFDIVFCSSVIEHVTVPKDKLHEVIDDHQFEQASLQRQREFAKEIERIGKRYFVQTPYKYFPIESHTWLPVLIVLLPRAWQIKVIEFLGSWWPKKTQPDWFLLTDSDLKQLFPDAEIIAERVLGIKKSIMAVKR